MRRRACSADRRRGALLLALASSLLLPVDAAAYCRTRAEPKEDKTAADYNPANGGGCKTKYNPLFWRNACVGYSIHSKGSRWLAAVDAARVISDAFTRWTGATCQMDKGTQRSRPSIDVRYLGEVECGKVEYVSGVANQNVIVFKDDEWKYSEGVLGLTTVTFSPQTGEILAADMEINTFTMKDKLVTTDEVKESEYDFLSVATHEAGHFLGFAHSDVENTVMFARYNTGEVYQRALAADDILAVCDVYKPDGERRVLEGKVYPGGSCDPTPRGGYSSACQEKPGFRCDASVSPARPAGNGVLWPVAIGGLAVAATTWRLRRRSRNRSTIAREPRA